MAARARGLTVALTLVMAATAMLAACDRSAGPTQVPRVRRIVSLVPAATEMLFAVGAGPQVVGVSTFAHFPAAVQSLPKVGALLNPDTERILALRPDVVIVYASQTDVEERFKRAGVGTFSYRHGVITAIASTMRTITDLAALTGHDAEGRAVVARIESRLAETRARVAGRPRPRTLLVISREPGTLQGLYAAGGAGFLQELLEIAGGTNVFGDIARESVQPSTETLLARRPDVILELRGVGAADDNPGDALKTWSGLAAIPAVAQRRIQVLSGDYMVVAGPRLPEAAEAIARALHPEAFE